MREESFFGPSEAIKEKFRTFFKLMDSKSADRLIHQMVPKQYISGTMILKADEFSHGIWFVIGGSVKSTHIDNSHIDLMEYTSETYFGDICLLREASERGYV